MFSAFLTSLVIILGTLSIKLYRERIQLQRKLKTYSSLISREEREQQLDAAISLKKDYLDSLRNQEEKLDLRIQELKQDLQDTEEEAYVQSFGFYEPKYDFVNSGDYAYQLKHVKSKQKKLVSEGRAAICNAHFVLRRSERESQRKVEKEGQKMTNGFLKLILKIFNSECDEIVSKVRHSNISSSENKMEKLFDRLNKISKVIDCEITTEYLSLKLKELSLKYEFACVKQTEDERKQALEKERREQIKIEKELEKFEEAKERKNHFEQALKNALREKESVLDNQRERLEIEIRNLREALVKAEGDTEKAEHRVKSLKEGYIYVISNIGSFGRDIYRICMTRRLRDPNTYINVMNPSVPFPFDIHFKFLSEDASDTLKKLHQRFDDKRVNLINERREFFKTSFEEIEKTIEEIRKETGVIKNIQREKAPQAYEYRRTQAHNRKQDELTSDHETA
ncbi:MAG: DUF4041 domain-containing protein [Cyanobacteria bacterium J06639_14]